MEAYYIFVNAHLQFRWAFVVGSLKGGIKDLSFKPFYFIDVRLNSNLHTKFIGKQVKCYKEVK